MPTRPATRKTTKTRTWAEMVGNKTPSSAKDPTSALTDFQRNLIADFQKNLIVKKTGKENKRTF